MPLIKQECVYLPQFTFNCWGGCKERLNYPFLQLFTGPLPKEFEANSDEIYQPLDHARLPIHLTDCPKALPGKLFSILYDRLIIP